jgi:hypothetical protein
MSKKSIGIFTNNISNDERLVLKIKEFMLSHEDQPDIFVFSDDPRTKGFSHTAILSSFYMRFYKNEIIFLNINDYLDNKDKILAHCSVFINPSEIQQSKINRKLLQNCNLLTTHNGTIRITEYATL